MASIQFSKLPNPLVAYKDVLLTKRPGLKDGTTIPAIEATIDNVAVDPKKLATYNKVCGFAETDYLPSSFPHIFAFPLHMAVLTHKDFPVALLGLVHVRNVINQHRRIKLHEKLNIHVKVEGHREANKGHEFDIVTTIKVGDELVWDSVSTMLRRVKGKDGVKKSATAQEEPNYERHSSWEVVGNTGRKYAAVSGDINPIHLSNPTAKLLGFKKAIIHGMWSLARTGAEVADELPEAFTYETDFKLPIFMPAWVLLKYTKTDNGIEYKLMDSKDTKPHMAGRFIFK